MEESSKLLDQSLIKKVNKLISDLRDNVLLRGEYKIGEDYILDAANLLESLATENILLRKQNNKYMMHLREKIYVDARPDVELPIRILDAYIDEFEFFDNLGGLEPTDWIVIVLNEIQKKRNTILRNIIDKLQTEIYNTK
jgi:hypothetical protein